MLPEAHQAEPPDATQAGAADAGTFVRKLLADLAVSYALAVAPGLAFEPTALVLACPRCATWAGRLYVVAGLGLGCAGCLAATPRRDEP